MSSRAAVYTGRLHEYLTDAKLCEGDDAAVSCAILMAQDIAVHGRMAMLERAQELLRLMDPRTDA